MRLSELIESINGVPVYAAKRRSGEKKRRKRKLRAFRTTVGISEEEKRFSLSAAAARTVAILRRKPRVRAPRQSSPKRLWIFRVRKIRRRRFS